MADESVLTAELRNHARRFFEAGVEAADPALGVRRNLRVRDGKLELGPAHTPVRAGPWPVVRVIAFGKAACAMAEAARDIVPGERWRGPGVAVTNHENVTEIPGFEVIGAGHPLPDADGVRGAKALAAVAERCQAGDFLLVLVSGGGSALVPYPEDPVSLADKTVTTEQMLGCGADIYELNTLRKHLSVLKGGGLARLASPAAFHSLILSDVIGDDLSVIASGPTTADASTYADAKAILTGYDLWDSVPSAVREHLTRGVEGRIPDTPKPGDPIFDRGGATLVGSNGASLAATRASAVAGGFETEVYSDALTGEAREQAERLASMLVDARAGRQGDAQGRPRAWIAGGETTVTVVGRGRGGRNQEMALAFALAAERRGLHEGWVFLSGGTDGRDGPTDAAGGVVDPRSLGRLRATGADACALLDDNNAYEALRRSGDLLTTGATGTNVADLQILLQEKL